ncbi:MAG: hypothetical protein ACM3QU_07905 [Verrucomicrobiota bacterium]
MNVDEFLTGARDAMTVRRVYGDPNEGGGFGLRARPVGANVIKDGEVMWRPAIDVVRFMLGWQVVAGIAALALWSLARRR